MGRDYITEIESLKERRQNFSFLDFSFKRNRIEKLLKYGFEDQFLHEEALKYATINTVACAEALFKESVKELIDINKEYYQNITEKIQNKSIKLDFSLVEAFQSERITVGELVSHILSYNKIEDLFLNFQNVTNKKLKEEILNNNRKYIYEDFNNVLNSFKDNSEEIIMSVSKIYESRHILCHEYANQIHIDISDFTYDLYNFLIFLECSYICIQELIDPNFPETTLEINLHATQIFQKSKNNLSKHVEYIKIQYLAEDNPNTILNLKTFEKAMKLWEEYSTSFSNFLSEPNIGGTLYQSENLYSLSNIYDAQLDYLEKTFK